MNKRADVVSGGSQLWYKYDTDSQIMISVVLDSFRLEWKISLKTDERINDQVITSSITGGKMRMITLGEVLYRARDFSFVSGLVSGRGLPTMISNSQEPPDVKEQLVQFAGAVSNIDCTLKSKVREIESILAKFKIKPVLEIKFGQILNDIYGKGEEWEFIPQVENPNEKRLAIRETGQLKYFSGFGDGFRSCVGIIGTALASKNTAIFMEEIESHQHAGSMKKLIKHLVDLARENNLQLFLSSHSKDLWESLNRGVYLNDPEKEKAEFRCFVIERDPETGKVTAERTDDVQKIDRALK
jgi:hypothetical protein